jgi:hypothetical protein
MENPLHVDFQAQSFAEQSTKAVLSGALIVSDSVAHQRDRLQPFWWFMARGKPESRALV